MALPYENATTGRDAMNQIRDTLLAFGCTKFAPMEDFVAGTVAMQFEYRGRMVQVEANAKGYAAALMKNPKRAKKAAWTPETALKQGKVAVWSILRDWIKGQITAVETGMMTFDGAFLGQILLPNGRTVLDQVNEAGILKIEGPKS